MDELIFLLILAGIGVVLLVAMFTYYKHHKKISDEIKDFNHHGHEIDDVLLDDSISKDDFLNEDFPESFTANRKDDFDIDDVQIKHDAFNPLNDSSSSDSSSIDHSPAATLDLAQGISKPKAKPKPKAPAKTQTKANNERELVDGVYINSKRVIKTDNSADQYVSKTYHAEVPVTEPNNVSSPQPQESPKHQPANASESDLITKKNIKIYYDPIPDGVEELIISHTILSRGQHFNGVQLFKALESAGLCYGEMDIYHYPGNEENDTFALFSVANIIEPGTFNLQEAAALNTPGISMFMRLPTRMPSYEAYEEFIHIAQIIATDLDGELCDETRSQLTQQAISYKKEQIRKLNFEMAKAEKLAASNS